MKRLPFLPGVVVHGHKWLFILSTREGSKMTLWVEWNFGDMKSVRNIYEIIIGVRELAS